MIHHVGWHINMPLLPSGVDQFASAAEPDVWTSISCLEHIDLRQGGYASKLTMMKEPPPAAVSSEKLVGPISRHRAQSGGGSATWDALARQLVKRA
jgi:hypothetical protein